MKKIIKDDVLQSDNIAIKDDNGNYITYRGLASRAVDLSRYIEERSLIFLLCDHHMETVAFLYEILYLNMVPLLLADDMSKGLLTHLIEIYKPQYIYCHKLHEICDYYDCKTEFDMHLLLKTGEERSAIHPDVAVLLSTSGTTGSAKLVKLSYANLYLSAEQVCQRMDIKSGQKGISPLSISYVYGFTFCIWHWHCGATLLITKESVLSKKFSAFYIREKANNFAGTPYIYQILCRIRFWDEKKLKYLHWAMSAGTQMSEKDQIYMVSLMKDRFWIMYGQTECTCFISSMNFDAHHIKLGSVGRLLNNMEASLDTITNELVLKGKTVCMGYAACGNQLADGDVNQGILHTGDIAYIDEEGCIYLKGRLSRYIKVLGKRICLDDIEIYLEHNIQSLRFACIGMDDQIFVFYEEKENNLNEQIPILLDLHMKIPRKFISCIYLETIPRNSAGKIRYGKLKELINGKENNGNLQ